MIADYFISAYMLDTSEQVVVNTVVLVFTEKINF